MTDIFLSYAKLDLERVRPLVERLEEHGWSVWWDREIPPGQTWPQLIADGLAVTKVMIVVWSEASVKSKWVEIEATKGEERGALIPVAIDPVEAPLQFCLIQAADLTAWDHSADNQQLQKVIQELERILGVPTPIAQPVVEQKEMPTEYPVDMPEGVVPTSPTSKSATETRRKQRAETAAEAKHQAEEERKHVENERIEREKVAEAKRKAEGERKRAEVQQRRQEAQRKATDEKVSRAHEKSAREAEEKEQLTALEATRRLEQEKATREREIATKTLEEQQRQAEPASVQASSKSSKSSVSTGFHTRYIFMAIFLIALVPGLYLWDQQQSENEKELIYQHTQDVEKEKKRLAALATAQKKPLNTFTDNLSSVGKAPVMVVIPAGSFVMGSSEKEKGRNPDEGPQHKVRIKSFALGKFEVTFAEYDLFAAATGRKEPSDRNWGRNKRPVINVNWDDATAYASWLSDQTGKKYRLPTEAEWEYAARSGSKTNWFWGDNEDAVDDFAWFSGNSGRKSHPVGYKKSNAFGLHDMLGNVWDWNQDCYMASYKGALDDGSAQEAGGNGTCATRVLRGGSWNYGPRYMRSADRGRLTPDTRNDNIGFRLARTL